MTQPNSGVINPKDAAAHELRSYVTGFVISLILTLAAFAAVLSDLSPAQKIVIVCVAGLLQVTTHLRNFLHLSFSRRQSREDLLLVLFSASLLAIMACGTIWILSDLESRMHSSAAAHAAPEAHSSDRASASGH